MKFTTLFFDLDDTLYPASSGLWEAIRERISLYMDEVLDIPREEIPGLRRKYFEEYGTALRGLEANYPVRREDYLAFVHDLPLRDYIQPDPELKAVLKGLPTRKLIFTNADEAHARRVMEVLEVTQFFDGIVDINDMEPYCKPMPESFQRAMLRADETNPGSCVLIDDMLRNTTGADLGRHAFHTFWNRRSSGWHGCHAVKVARPAESTRRIGEPAKNNAKP